MIILNLIRVLTLCQGSSPGRFFFPTNLLCISAGLCREDHGKTKNCLRHYWLCWTFSVTAAERIVVAGGSLTELIYAMGAGKRVVGVDETTSYPPETAKLPHIGYWKQLSSEGIFSLARIAQLHGRMQDRNCARPTAGAKVNVVTLPRVPATLEHVRQHSPTGKTLQVPEQGEALVHHRSTNAWSEYSKTWRPKKPQLKPCLFSPQAEVRHRLPVKAQRRGRHSSLLPEQKTSLPTSSTKLQRGIVIAANPEVIVVTFTKWSMAILIGYVLLPELPTLPHGKPAHYHR